VVIPGGLNPPGTPGSVVDVSHEPLNQAEEAIAVDPNNPSNVFVLANEVDRFRGGAPLGPGIMASYSKDGGLTWTTRTIADGTDGLPPSQGDPTVAWDQFGNLFVAYLDVGPGFSPDATDILMSTDGGVSFTPVAKVFGSSPAPAIDQPTIVVGPGPGGKFGSIWLQFNDTNNENAITGALVTGPGQVGPFLPLFFVPGSVGGNFGDIVVGPQGQVMVTYVDSGNALGPVNVMVSVKADGLGPGLFSPPTVAAVSNVGSFDPIIAQPLRMVDAEPGLAWDRSGGAHNGRVYLMYTTAPSTAVEQTITDVVVRFSDDMGKTWSPPVQVNDQSGNLHFLPKMALDQTTGFLGVSWYDTRNDLGGGGFQDTDGIPNDEPEFFAALSLNGGLSFQPNVQLTNRPSNSTATGNTNLGFNFGDFTGAAFNRGVYHAAWADNSLALGSANPDFPNFEIATATINAPALLSQSDVFEPNETSDKAHNFGTLNPTPATLLTNLTIFKHTNGLPDYDWFRWRIGASGTFAVGINVQAATGALELHLFTLTASNTLVELGRVASPTNVATFSGALATAVHAGEPILVEVKGVNSSPGVQDQGVYSLDVALG
jgi:hypothetical protein